MLRVILGLLCPLALLAQTSTLQGIVTDPSGAPVPEASVSAVLDSTGATRTVLSGGNGRYRLPALPVGVYTIRCEKAGFRLAE
ncbi:MAG TPA: carboxypeptidase-like regulatory domain-containing protein, partial [Bryobacteraceae bacterium]|nr:carboxypeptidase-like regulatory domain-containing protein [Bryobacteraceae bacterium]